MQRTISTILILLLLVSQGLLSAPHTHVGTSIVEPDGHSTRPHVHLHGGRHHHHHHENDGNSETPSAPEQPMPDHDSDAVYADNFQLLNTSKAAKVAEAEFSTVFIICDESQPLAVYGRCAGHHVPPIERPQCALFLRLLSIRC